MCFAYISEQKGTLAHTTLTDNFYSRDGKCLLRGTNWAFKRNGLRFILKGLTAQYYQTAYSRSI
jgi:hypothetical protein